jgi:hypothetical protein
MRFLDSFGLLRNISKTGRELVMVKTGQQPRQFGVCFVEVHVMPEFKRPWNV